MNQEKEKTYRVGIFVHLYQNLGNQATLLTTIQNLETRLPNAELVALTEDPDKASEKYNIESFPIRYKYLSRAKEATSEDKAPNSENVEIQPSSIFQGLKNLVPRPIKDLMTRKTKVGINDFIHSLGNLRNEMSFIRLAREYLKNLDAMMICGTGPIHDASGPWQYPYTIFKWVLMAKATNTKVFFVSVGAGPPTHPLSLWFFKKALNRADYVSYRSRWVKKMIEDRIPGINGLVYPDLVHSLKTTPQKNHLKKNHKIIAINPMYVFINRYFKGDSRAPYANYLDKLAEFVSYALDRGFSVKFFNSNQKDLPVIDDVIERLKKMPDVNIEKVSAARNRTIQHLVDSISDVDMVVATRFHSVLIPMLQGKPVIGFSYHQKTKELLEDGGLGEYCIDVFNFTSEELVTKFDLLNENREEVKRIIERYQKNNEKLLDEQWDHLVNLIKN